MLCHCHWQTQQPNLTGFISVIRGRFYANLYSNLVLSKKWDKRCHCDTTFSLFLFRDKTKAFSPRKKKTLLYTCIFIWLEGKSFGFRIIQKRLNERDSLTQKWWNKFQLFRNIPTMWREINHTHYEMTQYLLSLMSAPSAESRSADSLDNLFCDVAENKPSESIEYLSLPLHRPTNMILYISTFASTEN